jgi:mannose-6-phosphate isomerase-like protein (cupin superfamily)
LNPCPLDAAASRDMSPSRKRVNMKTIAASAALLVAAMAPCIASAQSPTVDHLTQVDLLQKAQQLDQQASQSGSASVKLEEYPNHYTMVALRKKSGGAEVHQNYADFFFVVRGKATLLTGGTVVDQKTASPGEIRGSAVRDGRATALQKGDVVHIPANVPHQLVLPAHGEFVYFVIKVKEQ